MSDWKIMTQSPDKTQDKVETVGKKMFWVEKNVTMSLSPLFMQTQMSALMSKLF